MITVVLVVLGLGFALFVGLLVGAGATLAVHQREFGIYKNDMQEMLDSRDQLTAEICEALNMKHAEVEALISQTAQLSNLNTQILTALCKSPGSELFVTTQGLKH